MKKLQHYFKQECERCHAAQIWVEWSAKLYKRGKVSFALENKRECSVCRNKSLRSLDLDEIDILKQRSAEKEIQNIPTSPTPIRVSPEDARDPSISEKERREDKIN